MPSRGMSKLRRVEKAGLIVLCVAMLVTLGLTGSTCEPSRNYMDETAGTFTIAGEKIEVDGLMLFEYGSWLKFQNFVLGGPPSWKFGRGLFGGIDPAFKDYQADTPDLWTFIILHHLAERSGVRVSPQAIQQWIQSFFSDEGGNFDRESYLRFIARSGVWASPGEFEKMLARHLAVEYVVGLYQPLMRPGSRQVYDEWKVRNKRHDVRVLVQPVGELRGDIDPASFAADEVATYYDQPTVKRKFLIPTKRSFEALHVTPMALSDEAFTALAKRAKDENLVTIGPDEARNYFFANRDAYPIGPISEKSRQEFDEKQAEKRGETDKPEEGGAGADEGAGDEGAGDEGMGSDGLGEGSEGEGAGADEGAGGAGEEGDAGDAEGEGARETGAEGPAEVWRDPAELEWTQQYEQYFKGQVERDLLCRRLLDRLRSDLSIALKAGDAEVTIESVAKDFGLGHYVTPAPLDQYELFKLKPIGGDALRTALNTFGADGQGGFCEKVISVNTGVDRTFLIFHVSSVVKEHYPDLTAAVPADLLRETVANTLFEPLSTFDGLSVDQLVTRAFPDAELPEGAIVTVETVVRLMLRQGRAEERAAERLNVVRELVLNGSQTLEGAAKEKGFEIRTYTGLSEETVIPPEIEPATGMSLTPEEVAKNRERAIKYFLVKGWTPGEGPNLRRIDGTEAQSFVSGNMADKETGSAFLVYVDSHRVPGPEEMPDIESRDIWLNMLDRRQRPHLQAFFRFETMVARYNLDVEGLTDKGEAGADGEGDPAAN